MAMPRSLVVLASVLVITACSDNAEPPWPTADPPATTSSSVGEQVSLTIGVKSESDRTYLCDLTLKSHPPQCGNEAPNGRAVLAWAWEQVDDELTIGETTWGGPYQLVGMWDGDALRLTEPPRIAPT